MVSPTEPLTCEIEQVYVSKCAKLRKVKSGFDSRTRCATSIYFMLRRTRSIKSPVIALVVDWGPHAPLSEL